jgi:hypothetical protein
MRFKATTIIAISLLFIFGCKRDSGTRVITKMGNGIRYEQWTDVSDSPRVLVTVGVSGDNSFDVVIPGDILSCQKSGRYIFGEKVPCVRPAAWMSSDWDRAGFFLLDPSAIDLRVASDDERYGKAVRWFDSKDLLEQALKSTP